MSFTHLSPAQRYQIERQRAEGKSAAIIARYLGIHRSTVYREQERGLVRGRYCAKTSHQRTLKRRAISAANHRTHTPELWQGVSDLLKREWSPQEISGRYTLEGAGVRAVSTQAIYNWLARTHSLLCRQLRHYRTPSPWRQGGGGMPKNRPSIRKRPKEVLKREQTGHWEGDTVMGRSRQECLVTLVERKSLYTRISPPLPKQSQVVAESIRQTLTRLSAITLTLDNGTEFAAYKAMGVDVFFADPGKPRQRSRNENTNGLIRQYVPKGARLSTFSPAKIQCIEARLNHRPRKTLGYKTPHEVLFNLPTTPVAIRT
jgi:transposase, IS30 family